MKMSIDIIDFDLVLPSCDVIILYHGTLPVKIQCLRGHMKLNLNFLQENLRDLGRVREVFPHCFETQIYFIRMYSFVYI